MESFAADDAGHRKCESNLVAGWWGGGLEHVTARAEAGHCRWMTWLMDWSGESSSVHQPVSL